MYRQAVTSAGSGAAAALDSERWLSERGIKDEDKEMEEECVGEMRDDCLKQIREDEKKEEEERNEEL